MCSFSLILHALRRSSKYECNSLLSEPTIYPTRYEQSFSLQRSEFKDFLCLTDIRSDVKVVLVFFNINLHCMTIDDNVIFHDADEHCCTTLINLYSVVLNIK